MVLAFKNSYKEGFSIQLYVSTNIHVLYMNTCLDPLSEGLHDFPTLKQILSLDIGIKCIMNDYNQRHITRELHNQGPGCSYANNLVTLYKLIF